MVAAVGREVVAAQHPVELRPQHLDQHVGTAGRVDLEQRVQPGPEAPGPLPLAVLLVPGLIDVEPRLAGQVVEQLLIGSLQRPADLGDDLGQFARARWSPDDVAEELADGRERGVAGPLEVGDQGGQARPDQAAALDRPAGAGPSASSGSAGTIPDDCDAPGSPAGTSRDVDLLDDAVAAMVRAGCRSMAAAGAGVEAIVEGAAVDELSGGKATRSCLGCPGWPPVLAPCPGRLAAAAWAA